MVQICNSDTDFSDLWFFFFLRLMFLFESLFCDVLYVTWLLCSQELIKMSCYLLAQIGENTMPCD